MWVYDKSSAEFSDFGILSDVRFWLAYYIEGEKGNFYQLLDAGMAFLFKHLNQSGVIKGLRREERLEIPVEALREALTNALCHRLLDSPSGSVGISVFDDRVEIENTGHLPNELTVETIKQSHRSFLKTPS